MCKFWLLIFIAFVFRDHHADAYKKVRLQDYLCSDKLLIALQKPFRGDPRLSLTEESDSAAIITQIWNATLPGFYSSNKIKYDCTFKIKTPENQAKGIYIAITRIKLRHDAHSKECIDYIQFTRGNRSPSERFCYKNSKDAIGDIPIFEQRDRDVTVHIHIDKRHAITEPLELRMIFTSHSICKNKGDFLCDPENENSCISRHFVRDNITNCMEPCRDEISCYHDPVITDPFDATSIAISAVTSLVLTMLGVGLLVWICWKYCRCIKPQHEHEVSAAPHLRNERQTTSIELPTAPIMDDVTTSSIVRMHHQQHQLELEEPQTLKDHPPSYESLFPDR